MKKQLFSAALLLSAFNLAASASPTKQRPASPAAAQAGQQSRHKTRRALHGENDVILNGMAPLAASDTSGSDTESEGDERVAVNPGFVALPLASGPADDTVTAAEALAVLTVAADGTSALPGTDAAAALQEAVEKQVAADLAPVDGLKETAAPAPHPVSPIGDSQDPFAVFYQTEVNLGEQTDKTPSAS